jgi:hypothetical protein
MRIESLPARSWSTFCALVFVTLFLRLAETSAGESELIRLTIATMMLMPVDVLTRSIRPVYL